MAVIHPGTRCALYSLWNPQHFYTPDGRRLAAVVILRGRYGAAHQAHPHVGERSTARDVLRAMKPHRSYSAAAPSFAA